MGNVSLSRLSGGMRRLENAESIYSLRNIVTDI